MNKGVPTIFDGSKADQLKAAMAIEESSSLALFVEFLPADGYCILSQNHRKNWVAFPSPNCLREIAKLLIRAAEQWEQNKVAGMPAPTPAAQPSQDQEDLHQSTGERRAT